jgi:DNA-binding response OmpR family regulator
MEDDPADAAFFVEMLGDLGYECEIFNRADRLISALDRATMLFLDIDLPDMSGVEILRNIRRDARYKNLPIIMLTVSGHAITVQVTRVLGANLFVEKSRNFYRFRHVVEQVMTTDFSVKPSGNDFLLKPPLD